MIRSAFYTPPPIIADVDEARQSLREEFAWQHVTTVLICLGGPNAALPRTVRVTPEVLRELVNEPAPVVRNAATQAELFTTNRSNR